MEPTRFDYLARLLGRGGSRRAALAALAALAGWKSLPRSAVAGEWCERNGIGLLNCGPGCNDRDFGALPCNCYHPSTHFCAAAPTGTVCRNGHTLCRGPNGDPTYCVDPNVQECCGNTYCAPGQCVSAQQSLCCPPHYHVCPSETQPGNVICSAFPCRCASGVPCGSQCCAAGQVCANNQCKDPDACEAGQGRRRSTSRADALCCNPATEQSCGDQCCSKENTCCGGGGAWACCPRGKDCCAGPGGSACCDRGEAFCCGGVCCANHRACADNRCVDQCPDGGVKCGAGCCPGGQICERPGTCRPCFPDLGETTCGNACCAEGQACKDGRCVADCPRGRTPCGDACCARNEACRRGRCSRKRRK